MPQKSNGDQFIEQGRTDSAMDVFAKLAEQKIQDAIKNGEFENLSGKGKPLDLTESRHIPPDLRMAYKVLKNSGMIPAEMEIRKEIALLEELIGKCPDEQDKLKLKRKQQEKWMAYSLLMEKRRSK